MTLDLGSLTEAWAGLLLVPGLVFLRISSAFFFLPAFGETMIPVRVRLALALGMTLLVTPTLTPLPDGVPGPAGLVALAAGEVVIGLILGLAIRLVYMALQVAGVMAAQATSLSQLLGGEATEPQPALGAILMMAGLALAMSLGLGARVVEMFVMQFDRLPPGRLIDGSGAAAWAVPAVGASFRLAFVLAAPFLILSILYNLGLGVINKAMPQLMVAFVGAPAITFGTILLLFLAAPALLIAWIEAMDDRMLTPLLVPR